MLMSTKEVSMSSDIYPTFHYLTDEENKNIRLLLKPLCDQLSSMQYRDWLIEQIKLAKSMNESTIYMDILINYVEIAQELNWNMNLVGRTILYRFGEELISNPQSKFLRLVFRK